MKRDLAEPVRWRLRSASPWQEAAAGSAFWFDNRARPTGVVIFQYTRRGSLDLHLGRRRLRVPPGSAALMRFGDASAYGLDSLSPDAGVDYACTYLTLQGAGLAEHWRELIALHGPCVAYGDDVLANALALIEAADPRSGLSTAQLALRVHAFVGNLYERPRASDGGELQAGARAIAALRADPCLPWSLKAVAARHGLSREHLARSFRAVMGETPHAFITRARLQRARTLLADTVLPVAEVARLCGYASARVLARNLVAATGRPPEAWRG